MADKDKTQEVAKLNINQYIMQRPQISKYIKPQLPKIYSLDVLKTLKEWDKELEIIGV